MATTTGCCATAASSAACAQQSTAAKDTGRGATIVHEAAPQAAYSKLLYRAARLPEAVSAGHRAAELKPDDVDTLNFLGAMLLQAGKADEAKQVYEKSLAIRPDQPNVSEGLKQINGQPGR